MGIGFVASVLSLSPRPKKKSTRPRSKPSAAVPSQSPLALSLCSLNQTLRQEEQAPRTQNHLGKYNQRQGPRSQVQTEVQRRTKYLDKFLSPGSSSTSPCPCLFHPLTYLPSVDRGPWTVADRRPPYSSYSYSLCTPPPPLPLPTLSSFTLPVVPCNCGTR